jgi:hypothetical protein
MLFRHLAKARAGEANADRLKTKQWPYAVIELYLGKLSPAATLDAAVQAGGRCEGQCYIGQWHVLKASKAEAEAALKVAVENCPKIRSNTPPPSQSSSGLSHRSPMPGARLGNGCGVGR